ncbi:calcium-binding protein [Tropicimonas aquimaris]|uniref:Calcium-binding protein n=1 Tax=Tropicimonas aquimaris TaxID=914152 RepID=A0ABW3IKF0_9RHOB
MPVSVFTKAAAVPSYNANVLYQFTNAQIFFEQDSWDAALPKTKRADVIRLKDDFTDYTGYQMKVVVSFDGTFKKVGGAWTGEITGVTFKADGVTQASIDINSGVDLSRIINVGSSTLVWNELTSTGLRGKLSGGNDHMNGSVGDDNLNGRGGADFLNGGLGDDKLIGGGGSDRLNGHIGDDTLIGGNGNDYLDGRDGTDVASGGKGNDTFLFDFNGDNVWTGGGGADRFQAGGVPGEPYGWTKVTDFKVRQGDKLDLTNDSALLFDPIDEIRFIGKKGFSGEEGVYEIQLRNGFVRIDQNGDGTADVGIELEGFGNQRVSNTSWILLPDQFDFA